MAAKMPDPPEAFQDFAARFPKAAKAWQLLGEQGDEGPLDQRTQRLVKLGIAVGAGKTGAVHSAVRKAKAAGITDDEMAQVVALAAATVGMPAAVAAFQWIQEVGKGGRGA